jgi:hypothetical protein
VLLAALMQGQPNMKGILYWAVGEGEPDWDSIAPKRPPTTTSCLVKEVARQAVDPDQIRYLDAAGRPRRPPSRPSNRLEVTAEFRGEDLVSDGFVSLREFGLFGGDATGKANSGYMIDYVIHPRLDLSSTDTLERKLRLTFNASGTEEEIVFGFGANLPLASLDGVGQVYARAYERRGALTLGDLAETDPLQPVGGIPLVRRREFQAKARLVMRLQVSPAVLEPFADLSVSRFLRQNPEDLAPPGMTAEQVQQLQETLADLQIALDDAELQAITLAELMDA